MATINSGELARSNRRVSMTYDSIGKDGFEFSQAFIYHAFTLMAYNLNCLGGRFVRLIVTF